jgi:hypothetical protein
MFSQISIRIRPSFRCAHKGFTEGFAALKYGFAETFAMLNKASANFHCAQNGITEDFASLNTATPKF